MRTFDWAWRWMFGPQREADAEQQAERPAKRGRGRWYVGLTVNPDVWPVKEPQDPNYRRVVFTRDDLKVNFPAAVTPYNVYGYFIVDAPDAEPTPDVTFPILDPVRRVEPGGYVTAETAFTLS